MGEDRAGAPTREVCLFFSETVVVFSLLSEIETCKFDWVFTRFPY